MISIYFLIFFLLFSWTLFVIGLKSLKDFAMCVISCFMIMIAGIYFIINFYDLQDLILTSIGVTQILLGFYWIIRCSVELNNPKYEPFNIFKSKWKK